MNRRGRVHVRRHAGPQPGRPGQHGPGYRDLGRPAGADPADLDITHTGQEETIDGVRIVFQVTPGTEAPSEMNFFFPDSAGAVHGRERHP